MPNTINLQKYANLLVETLPAAIENEAERQKFLTVINRLMKKGEANLSPEETKILGLMTVLTADYEKRTFTIQPLAPHLVLQSLLEDNELRQKDLLPIFKTEAAISEILNGKRPISKSKAEELGAFFHVSYKLFFDLLPKELLPGARLVLVRKNCVNQLKAFTVIQYPSLIYAWLA